MQFVISATESVNYAQAQHLDIYELCHSSFLLQLLMILQLFFT